MAQNWNSIAIYFSKQEISAQGYLILEMFIIFIILVLNFLLNILFLDSFSNSLIWISLLRCQMRSLSSLSIPCAKRLSINNFSNLRFQFTMYYTKTCAVKVVVFAKVYFCFFFNNTEFFVLWIRKKLSSIYVFSIVTLQLPLALNWKRASSDAVLFVQWTNRKSENLLFDPLKTKAF